MSSTSHDPFEGFDPTDLEGSFAAIEKAITSSEPIVRDFNRHFTDLLAACQHILATHQLAMCSKLLRETVLLTWSGNLSSIRREQWCAKRSHTRHVCHCRPSVGYNIVISCSLQL